MQNTMVASQMGILGEVMDPSNMARVEQTFAEIKAMGYNAAQLAYGSIPDKELAGLLKKNDIFLCSMHCDTKELIKDAQPVIDFAQSVGCHYIGVGGMFHEDWPWTEAGVDRFVKDTEKLARQIKDAGLQFTYHNHSFEFMRFGNETMLDRLFNLTDPDAFWFEIDTYWVQHGGADPAEWIRKFNGRMGTVHFKDMVYSAAQKGPYFTEVGNGNLNWPDIIKACGETGIQWHIVEQDETERSSKLESAQMSINNLHKMGLR